NYSFPLFLSMDQDGSSKEIIKPDLGSGELENPDVHRLRFDPRRRLAAPGCRLAARSQGRPRPSLRAYIGPVRQGTARYRPEAAFAFQHRLSRDRQAGSRRLRLATGTVGRSA